MKILSLSFASFKPPSSPHFGPRLYGAKAWQMSRRNTFFGLSLGHSTDIDLNGLQTLQR